MAHDKTTQINIHNVHGWQLDAEMRKAVLYGLNNYVDNAAVIDIYPQQRRDGGFIEWIMNIRYHGSTLTVFTVGVVQRAPGMDVEFHS